jgi:hypothetical protein
VARSARAGQAGNRPGHEPTDLAGGLAVQPVHHGDLDTRVGEAQAGQLGGGGPGQAARVGRGADDQVVAERASMDG